MSTKTIDFVDKRVEIRGAGLLVVKSDGTLESDKELRVDVTPGALTIFVGLDIDKSERKRKPSSLKNVVTGSIVSGGSIHIGDSVINQRDSRVLSSTTTAPPLTYRVEFKSKVQELLAYATQTTDPSDKISQDTLRVMWYADHIAHERLDVVAYGSQIELRVLWSIETLTVTATRAAVYLATSIDQCRARRAFLTACDNSTIARVTCGELHYVVIDSAVVVKVEMSAGHANQRGSERSSITK